MTAKEMAKYFYLELFTLHGFQRKIRSDRDSCSTSIFWTDSMEQLQISLASSAAPRPQTYGQSERAFRIVKKMLRCFVNSAENECDKLLPGLKLANMNHTNEAAKHTPFFSANGEHSYF